MAKLNEYRVNINGFETVLKLTEEDADRRGLTSVAEERASLAAVAAAVAAAEKQEQGG